MNPSGADQLYETVRIALAILGFGAVFALLLGLAMFVTWARLRGWAGKISIKSRRRAPRHPVGHGSKK